LSDVWRALPAAGAMVAWGVMDFLVKMVVDRISTRTTLLGSQVAGIVLCLVVMPFGASLPMPRGSLWVPLVLAGLAYVVGNLSLFEAFARGPLSIVSPISSSYGAAAALLAVVVLGEHVSWPGATAILVIAAGIVFASRLPGDGARVRRRASVPGTTYALGAVIVMAPFSLLLAHLTKVLEPITIVFAVKLVAAAILAGIAARAWREIRGANLVVVITIIGALDVAATWCYVQGIMTAGLSITAPIAAGYPVVTVLLAQLLLREGLTAIQRLGVILVLGGVTALNVVG